MSCCQFEILKKIAGVFKLDQQVLNCKALGEGHIHDTFRVTTTDPDHPGYVLQRINRHVFQNVPELMENIRRLTEHLRKAEISNNPFHSLILYPTKSGADFHCDEKGNYWRCSNFCENDNTRPDQMNPKKAFETGRAIGTFHLDLLDFPDPPLNETIPGFHDVGLRICNFENAIRSAADKKNNQAGPEIEKIMQEKQKMLNLGQLIKSDNMPTRITHNDTKINNFLFDRHDRVICIIDLDTVMNGSVLFDFGDALRTLASSSDENDPDIAGVSFNLVLYKAFSKGYIQAAGSFLTKTEIENLAFSPKLMTYIMAVRFLTDFLEGNVYYKVSNEKQNLVRAKNQLALLESMEKHFVAMDNYISKLSRN